MKIQNFLAFLFLNLLLLSASAQPGKKGPIKDFISDDAEVIFSDDFNQEVPEEFPLRWTHNSGNIQTNQVTRLEKKEGVVEFVSGGEIQPGIEDAYLGVSFKLELQCYFYLKGNESYTLTLLDKNDRKIKNALTIRSTGISHVSTGLARLGGEAKAGWRTIQLSFNKGNLKVYYEGRRLVHVPNVGNESFTHLKIYAASPGGAKGDYDRLALLNYLTIVKEGLPLYNQLTTTGKLVIQEIKFDTDSYIIQPSSYSILGKIVKMLSEHPEISITIQGHTDAQGNAAANKILGAKRAEAVKEYLVAKNIAGSRLKTVSFGSEKPIDPGNNETAWAKNRRVELHRN